MAFRPLGFTGRPSVAHAEVGAQPWYLRRIPQKYARNGEDDREKKKLLRPVVLDVRCEQSLSVYPALTFRYPGIFPTPKACLPFSPDPTYPVRLPAQGHALSSDAALTHLTKTAWRAHHRLRYFTDVTNYAPLLRFLLHKTLFSAVLFVIDS